MKKIFIILMAVLISTSLFAQTDSKAGETGSENNSDPKFYVGLRFGYGQTLVSGEEGSGTPNIQFGANFLYQFSSYIGIKVGLGVNTFGSDYEDMSGNSIITNYSYFYIEPSIVIGWHFYLSAGIGFNFKTSVTQDGTDVDNENINSMVTNLVTELGFRFTPGNFLFQIGLGIKYSLSGVVDVSSNPDPEADEGSLIGIYLNISLSYGF